MSAMATTLSRNPSLRAGLVGAILGATLALGTVFALPGFAPQADGSRDGAAKGGPAGAAVRGPAGVEAVLREHQAREYGAVSDPVVVPDRQAVLRQHQAREYGSVSGGIDFQTGLREQLAREYGSASASTTSFDLQAALREHQERESSAP